MAFLTGHPDSAWNDSLFLGALAETFKPGGKDDD